MNNMDYTDKEYCLDVWGIWACFTRPELKVERVSYDVITPSAARAIFEAILFKRYAMRWQVTKIEVLNPIKWTTIRRNEVGALAGKSSIFIEDKRQQKNSLLLQGVRYRIHAKLVFIPVKDRPKEAFIKHQPSDDENPMKYYQMLNAGHRKDNVSPSRILVAVSLLQIGSILIIRNNLPLLWLKIGIWVSCFMTWILKGMYRNLMPCFIV